MKILLYCQHVLGIGHLFRTLEIARALKEHHVTLVLGGPRASTSLPNHVRVVQLHGFSNAQRKTRAGAEAAVIVSGGSRWITPSADAVARCLAEFVDGPVALFPRDVTELGATTNLHGKILRRHGHEGFVHIELNLATRRWLLDDTARLQRFAGCLQQE